jgi:tripartite ATP-independent transporter DctM subunit
MSIELLTFSMIMTFLVLLCLGLPLAWTMGSTAIIYGLIIFGPNITSLYIARVYDMMLNYGLLAVPLFVFMGGILQRSGIAEKMLSAVHAWSGSIRGGLAIGTIVGCTIMAAMVGIVGAEIVVFGLVALPEMLSKKYNKYLALGAVSAGGGLATLIPPSIVFIVYAMMAGCSIGKLFIAGIVPGCMLAMAYILYIMFVTWIHPDYAPLAPLEERTMPLKAKMLKLKGLILPFLIILSVLGSLYAGIATASEAAALGCVASLISAYINKRFNFQIIKESMYETLIVSSMLAWLYFGSQAIIGVYTLAGGDKFAQSAISSLPFGRWGVMIGIQIVLIILGCFLDWIGILMLTTPLFLPVIVNLGFDVIWYGVVFCMNMHIAYLSPPFGPSCFYLKSVVPPEISLTDIFRGSMPYLYITLVVLAITVAFPQLALWLPARMG